MTENLAAFVGPDFPGLHRRVAGRSAVFLDGPAGSQVPRVVIDAVADHLAHRSANTGGVFATSRETDEALFRSRERLAAFVGGSAGEIAFGPNMTTLTYLLSRALAREWGPGDEVVVTEIDHQANVEPWRRAAEERGATVRVVPFDPETLTLDYESLERCVGPRTRLVAVGCASNAVGTVHDVTRVARLARASGALVFADAVHLAAHLPVDVRALECDFLVCSAYKFFGPHVGVLWMREALVASLAPYRLPPSPDRGPERWETGTQNHASIVGAGAAVEWIAGLAEVRGRDLRESLLAGWERIHHHESGLLATLLSGLAELHGVRVHGPPRGAPRTATVSFTLAGLRADEVVAALAERGIFSWSGDFYASTVVDRLGLRERGGLVRVGLAPYTAPEDVTRLLEALVEIGR
jgi:cysteine desulfurase family protein (TIGR01976 family)